ncbi:MAG: hypothetical protein SGPRY_014403 [Prymnesium sp.]
MGSSGALYSIFFNAVAVHLAATTQLTPKAIADSLAAGSAAISKYGGAARGHRTMLDALLPAANAMQQAAGLSLEKMLQASQRGGVEGRRR